MTNQIEATGHCLCGAVTFTATVEQNIEICHCGMCQHWIGGPNISANAGDRVTFTGNEQITVYDSSSWAERAFCNRCGSPLFYRLKAKNEYHMPIGIFDDKTPFELTTEIFYDRKPPIYSFANETEKLTEEAVFKRAKEG